jgi:hypothetical protein
LICLEVDRESFKASKIKIIRLISSSSLVTPLRSLCSNF